MNRLLRVGLSRIRFWRDEVPDARYVAERVLERRVTSAWRDSGRKPGTVAIELWVPMGPRALYGLLGIRYEGDGPDCEIRVPVIGGLEGPPLADNIAASYDEVRVGLPDEFGREVVDRLAQEAEVLGLAGNVTVEWAAHSLVGSSRSVFAALSGMGMRLLAEPFGENAEECMEEVVRDFMRVQFPTC